MDDLLLRILVFRELEEHVYVIRLVSKQWYDVCMDERRAPLQSRLSAYLEGGPRLLHWIIAQPGARAALRADGKLRATLAFRSVQLGDAALLAAAAPLPAHAHFTLVNFGDAPFVERMLRSSLFAHALPARCFEAAYMRDGRDPGMLAALARVFGGYYQPSRVALRHLAMSGDLDAALPAYGGKQQLVLVLAADAQAAAAVAAGLATWCDVRALREWVRPERSPYVMAAALRGALLGANERLVDELLALGAEIVHSCVLPAMHGGSLRLLERVWTAAPVPVDARSVPDDTEARVLDWSLEHGCIRVDEHLVTLASRLARFDVLEQLLDAQLDPARRIQMGAQSLGMIPWAGHRRGSAHVLRVLELLWAHGYAPCDEVADAAAGVGHVDVLEWLRGKGCTPTPRALQSALSNHNWQTLEWMRRHGKHEELRTVPLWREQLLE